MNFLITSHGSFCNGILDSFKMLVGNCDNIFSLSLESSSSIHDYKDNLNRILDEISVEPTIILVDIKGGTPFNESYNYLLRSKKENLSIICGVNLPMVLELYFLSKSNVDINYLSLMTVNSGKNAIEHITYKESTSKSPNIDELLF